MILITDYKHFSQGTVVFLQPLEYYLNINRTDFISIMLTDVPRCVMKMVKRKINGRYIEDLT